MKNKLFFAAALACVVFTASGCTTFDPYKYKDDGRKVYRISVEAPGMQAGAGNGICLINKSIAVFPFIDNRKLSDLTHGTSIPLSMLAAETFVSNAQKYGIFSKIEMAPLAVYLQRPLSFDPQGFASMKAACRSNGIIWGNINAFETAIAPSGEFQYYDLTLFISGSLKMMLAGRIYYNKEFSKKRTYRFKSTGWLTYTPDDIYGFGPYISDFIGWVMKGELDTMAINSRQIMNGGMIADDITPDMLSYPPQNTKAYSFREISTVQMNATFIMLTGEILGGFGGGFLAYYAGGGGANGAWMALAGFPLGMLAGVGVAALLNMGNVERMEKEALFYACRPSPAPDVVISMNFYNNRF